MEFENDIFISYAHIDNETLSEEQKGWISAFHRALEVRLGQLLGKKPNIFRDPKLQGNDVFGDRLVEALPKTAALVSIISPRYVRSEWCLRELVKFVEASEQSLGLRLGTKSRIFKIVKTPIPFEKHPESVQDLLGYEFFSVDQATGRPTELSQDTAGVQQQYWAKLNDLAYDLCEILEGLEGAEGSSAPAPRASAALPAAAPPAAEGSTVFLAQSSHDLRDERDSLLRLLQQHGHTVLPDCPLPLVADECAALLREQLVKCGMSIHLVGANYGIVPEGTSESLVALQNELAIERGSADDEFQRLIWLPSELATDDERQQKLVDELRNDSRIQHGADILETPIAELKLAIRKKLEPPPVPATDEEAIFLAVTSHDLRDQHDRLERFLTENGHPVLPERHNLPLVAGECESYLRE
ncbi:MAG: hypothetical protein GY856_26075, partial [bacterium]|nr:hypothetical protein [bacterium]